MTTPTLTHEQALLVRAWQLTAEQLEYLRDTNVIYLDASESTPLYFNGSKAALAKYDAEWVTIRRASLRSVLTDVPHEAPHEVAHVISDRLRAARSELANAAGCVLGADDAGGSGREWVTIRREHLEELRDAAQAAVNEHAQTFAGYPNQMAKMAPTEQAIAHANEVLEGK